MFVCGECGQRYDDRGGYCPSDGTALTPTDDPLLGTEVGRYRLARLVGEGGMGRVYLAVQPVIGSRVAVKILSDQCARDPELLERFFAEARAVNLIRHENIVQVIDLSTLPDGRPYIVMEFIEGQTLGDLVRAGSLPLGGLVQVMGEMLSALGAAHAIGIVHRDLKPDNVLVTAEGHAKVLDFGIAKLAPKLQDALSPRTRTGALLGTPAYMAPEQITGSGQIDPRTDLYAAGVVMFEAATGRPPFMQATLFDLMKAHMEESPPSPRAIRDDLPVALEAVILQAMAKHPTQRFQTAAEMNQAMYDAASQLPPDQWRALSSRGGGMMSKPQPTPSSPLMYRDVARTRDDRPPRAGGPSVATVAASPNAKSSRGGKSKLPVVVVLLASVAITTTLVVVALHRGHGDAQADVVAELTTSATPTTSSTLVSSSPTPAPTIATPAPTSRGPSPPVPAQPPAHGTLTVHGSESAAADVPRVIEKGKNTVVVKRDSSTPEIKTTQGRAIASAPNEHEVAPPSGVRAEGSVHFVEVSPTAAKTKAADYNPKRFDPVAYLPKARELAREILPDAQLTRFEFDPVFPDGHVDVAMGRDHDYDFRSPSKSVRPAGTPKNVKLDQPCLIHVEVGPTAVVATLRTSETCTERIVHEPQCTFAQLFAQAKTMHVASDDIVVRIAWLFDEKWFFDTDPDSLGKGGGVNSLVDRCP